jgi:tRNA(His) 5'-end guanylyltransferase
MTDQDSEKSDLEKSRDIISQLKEMQHYSKTNIEKLGEFWLLVEAELKQKENAEKLETLLTHQNSFHEALESMISDYEIECNRIENEAS